MSLMRILTELRVKVCSMYGAVCSLCLACLQCCCSSTRLMCGNKSIRQLTPRCVCVCSQGALNSGGERQSKILTATESSNTLPLLLLCLASSLPPSLTPYLPPSLSLSSTHSIILPFPFIFLSLCLHSSSQFLLRPQSGSLSLRQANQALLSSL